MKLGDTRDAAPAARLGRARFDGLVEAWLTCGDVTRGTMMGFPCLRVEGQFFASLDREGTRLIVKLDANRVREAVAAGEGEAFAPNGRVFREWLQVPLADAERWDDYLREAYRFVSGARASKRTR